MTGNAPRWARQKSHESTRPCDAVAEDDECDPQPEQEVEQRGERRGRAASAEKQLRRRQHGETGDHAERNADEQRRGRARPCGAADRLWAHLADELLAKIFRTMLLEVAPASCSQKGGESTLSFACLALACRSWHQAVLAAKDEVG